MQGETHRVLPLWLGVREGVYDEYIPILHLRILEFSEFYSTLISTYRGFENVLMDCLSQIETARDSAQLGHHWECVKLLVTVAGRWLRLFDGGNSDYLWLLQQIVKACNLFAVECMIQNDRKVAHVLLSCGEKTLLAHKRLPDWSELFAQTLNNMSCLYIMGGHVAQAYECIHRIIVEVPAKRMTLYTRSITNLRMGALLLRKGKESYANKYTEAAITAHRQHYAGRSRATLALSQTANPNDLEAVADPAFETVAFLNMACGYMFMERVELAEKAAYRARLLADLLWEHSDDKGRSERYNVVIVLGEHPAHHLHAADEENGTSATATAAATAEVEDPVRQQANWMHRMVRLLATQEQAEQAVELAPISAAPVPSTSTRTIGGTATKLPPIYDGARMMSFDSDFSMSPGNSPVVPRAAAPRPPPEETTAGAPTPRSATKGGIFAGLKLAATVGTAPVKTAPGTAKR